MKQFLENLIRVNHAGEYGAKRIYEGQLAVLKDKECSTQIKHMLEQELEHLKYFEKEMADRQVRPSFFSPLWHVGGYALGAFTAMLGEKSAYACTVAVEEVIDEHYKKQLQKISELTSDNDNKISDAETLTSLAEKIEKFRQEEVEHKEISEHNGAEAAPFYPLLHFAVSNISRLAIKIAEKV